MHPHGVTLTRLTAADDTVFYVAALGGGIDLWPVCLLPFAGLRCPETMGGAGAFQAAAACLWPSSACRTRAAGTPNNPLSRAQGSGFLSMLLQYLPIALLLVVGVAIGAIAILAGRFIGPNRPDAQKTAPYECGFEAFEDARMKFDVRYYLVAILFIIFDLEVAFLFPWAVGLKGGLVGGFGFAAMMLFLGLLVIGFIYEWKKGALEWE
jgi:NADH-quinone oxidoreductase subunit A